MIERGVLYIVDPSTNGIKQHVLILLKYLNRARYKPYLVLSDDPYLEEHAKQLELDHIKIPAISGASKLTIGGVVKQIEEFVGEREVNLVHSHGYSACFVGAQAANSLNIPHISTVHMVAESHKKKSILSLANLAPSNDKVITLPDHLIAVSEVTKKYVESLNDVSLIYNGIEAERYAETLDTEHLYRELSLKKDNKLVGTVTNLALEKGLGTFLEATAILLKKNPNIHFIVVGDGGNIKDLQRVTEKQGVAGNVHFLGFRRDVAHILKSLDVVVISNSSPGLPLILLEALACIRPVVVTDTPGIREVFAEDSVQFVPESNASSMAEAVEGLLLDQGKANSKAQSGQKIVCDGFTVKHMLKPTESLYLKIAG